MTARSGIDGVSTNPAHLTNDEQRIGLIAVGNDFPVETLYRSLDIS